MAAGGVLIAIFFFGLIVASLVFWIWALVDCIKVPDDSMYQSGNKLIWVLVIVFLQVVGAIIYLIVGRPAAGAMPPSPPGLPPSMPPPPV